MAHGECELACGRLVMAALSTGTQRDSNFGRQSRCKSGLDDPVRGKRGCIHAEVAGNDSQEFASAARPSSTPRSAGPGPGARLGSINATGSRERCILVHLAMWVGSCNFFCFSPYVYACVHVQVAGRSSRKFRGSDALECSWLPCMFYGRMQIIVVVKGVYASAILGQEH